MQLQGVYTALVTPFKDGRVDYAKIKELVAMQLEENVAGIVPVGTTGESPTLSVEEHTKVIETVIKAADEKCQIIAGTGANSTAEAIELTKNAKAAGADATLQVTPYYNKPTQEGLYAHFATVADEAKLPVVLYNVPGRSGVPIAIDTIQRLSENSNVIAVKEAGGSVERVSAILDVCDITVLSGDDALTLPMLSVGASGVISVASNLIPEVMVMIVNEWFAGNHAKALELHKAYYRFFKDCFIETNPIPIKAAMAVKGILEEEYRLPLCPMQEANLIALKDTMHFSGLI